MCDALYIRSAVALPISFRIALAFASASRNLRITFLVRSVGVTTSMEPSTAPPNTHTTLRGKHTQQGIELAEIRTPQTRTPLCTTVIYVEMTAARYNPEGPYTVGAFTAGLLLTALIISTYSAYAHRVIRIFTR